MRSASATLDKGPTRTRKRSRPLINTELTLTGPTGDSRALTLLAFSKRPKAPAWMKRLVVRTGFKVTMPGGADAVSVPSGRTWTGGFWRISSAADGPATPEATAAPGGGAKVSVLTFGFGRRSTVIGVPTSANCKRDLILAARARLLSAMI